MRIALLSNPSSGRGRHSAADEVARRVLSEAGHEVLHVRGSSYEQARHAGSALLEDGSSHGVEALVVVGGDGMVHLGADIVATTGVPLGVVATGTGNDIARHFGLPSRDAAVNARANTLTWPAREGRYVRAFTAELAALAPYGYRVTTDEGTWEGPALLLAVANTRYIGGGMDLAPQADPADGLLEILRLDPVGRPHLVSLFSRLFKGTHLTDSAVHLERSRVVAIEALDERTGRDRGLRPPPHPFADGEPLAELPLRLEAVPDAVRLLLAAQGRSAP